MKEKSLAFDRGERVLRYKSGVIETMPYRLGDASCKTARLAFT